MNEQCKYIFSLLKGAEGKFKNHSYSDFKDNDMSGLK